MNPRHLRTLLDLTRDELQALLDDADRLKRGRNAREGKASLEGKSVVILLDKASTRTRVSFEVGVHELGGLPVTLISRDTQVARGEPLADTARMFSRYAHAIVYRTFAHERVEGLSLSSSVPVINGLSDSYHPCQLLADLMTIREHFGRLEGVRVAWVGDGNNMAHSCICAAARTGVSLRVATPQGYRPDPAILERAVGLGADVEVLADPAEAAEGAEVVMTDVWASMGQEEEQASRRAAFSGYRVDAELMRRAKPGAIFLHCLPAHRGEEVSADVIDGPASRVWDEAENRLHAQKALLRFLMLP